MGLKGAGPGSPVSASEILSLTRKMNPCLNSWLLFHLCEQKFNDDPAAAHAELVMTFFQTSTGKHDKGSSKQMLPHSARQTHSQSSYWRLALDGLATDRQLSVCVCVCHTKTALHSQLYSHTTCDYRKKQRHKSNV